MSSATEPPSDGDLVVGMAADHQWAAGELYDRYSERLYALAFRIVEDGSDAEEAVVDTFAQAWRSATTFNQKRGSVGAWLTVIVRSRALDITRARSRRQRVLDAAETITVGAEPDVNSNPAHAAESAERRTRVQEALGKLSDVQRDAIEMAFYRGFTHLEIAERRGVPLGTVKTRIRDGMRRLRDALLPLNEGLGS